MSEIYQEMLALVSQSDAPKAKEIFKIVLGARRLLNPWETALAFQLATRSDKLQTRVDVLIGLESMEGKIQRK